jgi:hypothetical protein
MPKGVSRYVVEPEVKRQVRARARKYAPEDKPLSRREELFVKELVAKDGQITMREAAMNAGFPEKSAHARAWEMTNPERSPHVVKAIREFRAQLDRKYGIDYKRHLARPTDHPRQGFGERGLLCRRAGRISARAGPRGYLCQQVRDSSWHHRQHEQRRSPESHRGVEAAV